MSAGKKRCQVLKSFVSEGRTSGFDVQTLIYNCTAASLFHIYVQGKLCFFPHDHDQDGLLLTVKTVAFSVLKWLVLHWRQC